MVQEASPGTPFTQPSSVLSKLIHENNSNSSRELWLTVTAWLIASTCFCWNHKCSTWGVYTYSHYSHPKHGNAWWLYLLENHKCSTWGVYRSSQSFSNYHRMRPNKAETAVCGSSICLLDDCSWGGNHWLPQIELQSHWPGINLYWPGQVWHNVQWLLPHINDTVLVHLVAVFPSNLYIARWSQSSCTLHACTV